MCFHLLTILAGQSHIGEVIVFSQVPESTFDVLLKVIPLEAQLLWHFEELILWTLTQRRSLLTFVFLNFLFGPADLRYQIQELGGGGGYLKVYLFINFDILVNFDIIVNFDILVKFDIFVKLIFLSNLTFLPTVDIFVNIWHSCQLLNFQANFIF